MLTMGSASRFTSQENDKYVLFCFFCIIYSYYTWKLSQKYTIEDILLAEDRLK